jgi:hypothetical protein
VAGQLGCSLSVNGVAGAWTALVPGLVNLQVYYGVKRTLPLTQDYNVDTYVTAVNAFGTDFMNVSAVRVILTFTNPLANQAGQPATLQFERVVEVMARAGDHT